MAKKRGLGREDVAFYVVVAIIVALVALKWTGALPEPKEPPTYDELCKDACNEFGLEHYSSEEYFGHRENDRCWCLDSGGLPKEVPVLD